jgi:hypothetical protein
VSIKESQLRGSEQGSQSHSVPTIADLIQARRAERGWSYRTLADRADHVFSAQRWQQLGTGVRIKEFPEPATIQAMADALEVDVASVVLAAAASIGLPVERRQSELAAMLPSNADDLTEEQRDAVLAVIRAMTPKETTHGRTEEVTEPRTQARSTEHSGEGRGGSAGRSSSMKSVKVTRLNRTNQVESLSGDDMPPPNYSQRQAARTRKKNDGVS